MAFQITALEDWGTLYGFDVYPNPTKEQITLSWENLPTKPWKISLKNLLGEVLILSQITNFSEEAKLAIAHLPKGIYILEICSAEGCWERKIVKQ